MNNTFRDHVQPGIAAAIRRRYSEFDEVTAQKYYFLVQAAYDVPDPRQDIYRHRFFRGPEAEVVPCLDEPEAVVGALLNPDAASLESRYGNRLQAVIFHAGYLDLVSVEWRPRLRRGFKSIALVGRFPIGDVLRFYLAEKRTSRFLTHSVMAETVHGNRVAMSYTYSPRDVYVAKLAGHAEFEVEFANRYLDRTQ